MSHLRMYQNWILNGSLAVKKHMEKKLANHATILLLSVHNPSSFLRGVRTKYH